MRKFLAIILSFQLLVLSLGGIKATLYYTLNKAYIIKELCIQKDAVENTCQGQCHLHETIKKQARQDQDRHLIFEGHLSPFCAPIEGLGIVTAQTLFQQVEYFPWINHYPGISLYATHRPPPAHV
ncbi:MAG: hypothetical protein GC180_04945 [Bacteroidetes bacterium]|nr:hypothetical protein [Bacteroidota bacterium]